MAFHLFERGLEQHILSVSETEVPVSVIIVIDESGSVGRDVTQCVQTARTFRPVSGSAAVLVLPRYGRPFARRPPN